MLPLTVFLIVVCYFARLAVSVRYRQGWMPDPHKDDTGVERALRERDPSAQRNRETSRRAKTLAQALGDREREGGRAREREEEPSDKEPSDQQTSRSLTSRSLTGCVRELTTFIPHFLLAYHAAFCDAQCS